MPLSTGDSDLRFVRQFSENYGDAYDGTNGLLRELQAMRVQVFDLSESARK